MHKGFLKAQKGLIQVIVLLLLAAGIGVGVYLVQQRTNWLPKAGGTRPNTPQTSFSLVSLKPGYNVGEEVSINVMVRSDIAASNLFSAKMSYDKDLLEFKSIGDIDEPFSFIKNWVEKYTSEPGKISLVGGVPNPGFKTQQNGIARNMAWLTFKALKAGTATISFDDTSAIYSNADNANILTGKDPIAITIGTPSSPTPAPPVTGDTQTIRVWVLDHHEPNYYHPYIRPDPVTWTRDKLLPALNEASKYHGYANPNAQPALNYTLFDYKQEIGTTLRTDYVSIFQRYDLCNYAKTNDIKVIMTWGTEGPAESMVTGSKGIPTNGPRMPSLCPDKTIVVYSLNYERELDEAMEAVGHHYETVFRNFRPVEWYAWSGENKPANPGLRGNGYSCGTIHNPPNARCEYDRSNPAGWLECGSAQAPSSVLSDCKDWKPDGSGIKEPLDCNAWDCKTKGDDAWMKWWMQNVPGLGNTLVGTDGQKIPNWWTYIGDPDSAVWGSTPRPSASPRPSVTPSPVPSPSSSPQQTTGTGDGNNDGKVDLQDLSILFSDHQKTGGFRVGIDMNGDGVINSYDYSLMRNLLVKKGVIRG